MAWRQAGETGCRRGTAESIQSDLGLTVAEEELWFRARTYAVPWFRQRAGTTAVKDKKEGRKEQDEAWDQWYTSYKKTRSGTG